MTENIGLLVFWGSLALMYIGLSVRNYMEYRRIVRIQGDRVIAIEESGRQLMGPREKLQDDAIVVSDLFKSIIRIDVLGFLLAGVGAILTAFTI